VYLELQKRLADRLRVLIDEKYSLALDTIPVEIPPDLKFGELATPIALQLARTLRKAPKAIAQEIVSALGTLPGFAGFEVAGAGYINARIDRASGIRSIVNAAGNSPSAQEPARDPAQEPKLGHPYFKLANPVHSLVEHTSINPNKAAHIGHLRNAILGDTFVRLLRASGQKVDVQNYIDNTGVQVADVVVGFLHVEGRSLAEVRALIDELKQRGERIDYYCWDLYARTSAWYDEGTDEENSLRKKLRYGVLHQLEEGGNETAEVADLISTAVLRRHLETMLRLGIEYDFLPRESEILHLHFWDLAFEQLKQKGVLYFETEGKNKGCWVMTRPGSATQPVQEQDGPKGDEDAKVIVRSNGTVTYVGKDIAYHLWKFGLLGRDFGYKQFFHYPDRECWISAVEGEAQHPHFGGATAIYNVIDVRQNDPQAVLVEALRGMGYIDQANHCIHFGYEKVALTPRCALELGYEVAPEDLNSSYILVSGRKGFGVKADDLIDKLIAATRAEVEKRQTGGSGGAAEQERQRIAEQIAIGALRYFMLKFTRNSVIAFDFKDALSFEGETGPYCQYAVVRIRNIFRKGNTTPEAVLAAFANLFGVLPSPADPRQGTASQLSESRPPEAAVASGHDFSRAASSGKNQGASAPEPAHIASYLSGEENEDIWALWLRAGRRSMVLEQCISTSEPAHLAKHAFQLAQEFSNFYHHHHILTEEDPARKTFLLATAAVVLRELVTVLSWLGIESPEAM
jgi:arginyl-tRNA synthetase